MTHSPTQNGNTATRGSEEVGSGGKQVSETVSEVMDQAQNTARQVGAQAKQGATSRLESQKERAVDSLVTVAEALRQTEQHLYEQDQETIGTYVEKAAERVESLTNHLRANDVPQLLAETQDFARRRPALFLGAALVVGFAGARFLMSSGQRATATDTPHLPQRWNDGKSYPYGVANAAPALGTSRTTYDSPGGAKRPNTSGIAGTSGSSAS